MARHRDTLPSPNGCALCGVDREVHLQRHAPDMAWHVWQAPTDAQRKQRILARRNSR